MLAIKLVLSEILLNSKINLAKKFSFNVCKHNMLNKPNAIRRCGSGGSSNSSGSMNELFVLVDLVSFKDFY